MKRRWIPIWGAWRELHVLGICDNFRSLQLYRQKFPITLLRKCQSFFWRSGGRSHSLQKSLCGPKCSNLLTCERFQEQGSFVWSACSAIPSYRWLTRHPILPVQGPIRGATEEEIALRKALVAAAKSGKSIEEILSPRSAEALSPKDSAEQDTAQSPSDPSTSVHPLHIFIPQTLPWTDPNTQS